jgi:subtilisin family serine protease
VGKAQPRLESEVGELKRLRIEVDRLGQRWHAKTTHLERVEKAYDVETDPSVRFKLESDIARLRDEREAIARQLIAHEKLLSDVVRRSAPAREEPDQRSTWGVARIGALAVWDDHDARGAGVVVGVLSTGIDAAHPDLESKTEHWAEFDSMGRAVKASRPHDAERHGTHCAGVLVGGDSSGKAIGVAPDSRLAVAKVAGERGATDASVLGGFDWLIGLRVDVILIPIGVAAALSPEVSAIYSEAILSSLRAGIPVIVPVGNDGLGTVGSPGNDPYVLSVGATAPDDRTAGFSGGATRVLTTSDHVDPSVLPLAYSKPELSAPGVQVTSSIPGARWEAVVGTSMSAAHVAGAIALLLSATRMREDVDEGTRAFAIQDLLIATADDLGEWGHDIRYGHGIVNAHRAVQRALEAERERSAPLEAPGPP